MNDLNLWSQSTEYTQIILNLLVFVIVTGAGLAGLAVSAGSVWKAFRWTARTIYPLVDEPAEQAAIATSLHLDPALVAQLAALIKAAQDLPVQEVNIGGAPK